MRTLFSHNIVLVFFIYGLAFFTMGVAVALEWRRSSGMKMASALGYLAGFGLLSGLSGWLEMFLAISRSTPGPTTVLLHQIQPTSCLSCHATPVTTGAAVVLGGIEVSSLLKAILLAAGAFLLIQFGVRLILITTDKYRWLSWMPFILLALWVAGLLLVCLPARAIAAEWLTMSGILTRYLLYLPGAILAAIALASQRPLFQAMDLSQIARDCGWASALFGLDALITGLVVPGAAFFPASVLNYGTFFAAVGVPVQVWQATFATLIAYFIVRILRIFEIEQNRQLEKAIQERFQAQQQTLEVQRRAQEEAERWSKELEGKVEERTRELEQRHRETEALYNVGLEITALAGIDKILHSVVEKAHQLLGSEVVALALFDEERQEIFMKATSGVRTEEFKQIRLKPGQGLAGKVIGSGEPVEIEDYCTSPTITHEMDPIVMAEGLRSHLAVPLRIGERAFGTLYVAYREVHKFTQADIILLTRLANQAAIAIENARLYDQVQRLAVLEERDRIGREMHDGLAQVLGLLSLKSRIAGDLLLQGEVGKARAEIQEMERVSEDAYADVREAILDLRTTVSPGRGLISTLTEYLHKFSRQHGIHTELIVGDGFDANFSPTTEIQLIRIIQEALTNVRKHAQSTRAWVRLDLIDGQPQISIGDDGQGFDVTQVALARGEHFGLETMRERAESVGGAFEIQSSPGRGTKIIVSLPIA
ncbi:MAG: GAF domain-containing protein [Chloroflexi bacterium]|nr:GAF domain-containing protein [Chloroflexota bacterium]MCL5075135.1 GAF domain-containing protein [Chloroflexota bacterium]